ncbi:stage III sporulation protein AF [Defluviitalea phaphyphila]|uniref:stage III sporulation protein AF n=1 Tax=Defluviitalea phaphyphila TaxID=1473580 RepID=UPI000731D611|nr:stage III sporulation protein AF [Defluviitalea phaphyphila]
MIYLFGDWIKNIAFFVIFSEFIQMLMPEGHFRKYIKMILSLILILILIRPIMSIFFKSEDEFYNLIKLNQLEIEKQSILNESSYITNKQDELIMETYKLKLKNQIDKLIEGNIDAQADVVEIIVNENKKDENFGNIEEVYIVIKEEEESNGIKINEIEPIKINIKKEKVKEEIGIKNTELEKNIKNLLINFYNLSSDNIYITVQKK